MYIYSIRNKINNKCYIGKTIDFKMRKKEHKRKLKSNKHSNKHLQNSWNKYGKENFEFFIILKNIKSDEEASILEIMFISLYNSNNSDFGYNLTSGGDGVLGYKATEETIKKIKESQRKRYETYQGAFLGKSHSEESRIKISKAQTGKNNSMYGRKHSEETKKKISEKMKIKNKNKQSENKKIDENMINYIKKLLDSGLTQTKISEMLDIPQPKISLIKNGKY